MKNIFKDVINRGDYNLSDMLKKIDTHHINGNISDEDRDELINLARNGANAKNGIDVFAKLAELEARVSELETAKGSTESDTPDEYIPGKWYYGGNKVMFKGEIRTCTAPEGVVCTWSPDEYPAYWD